MIRTLTTLAAGLAVTGASYSQAPAGVPKAPPPVDLAICLDTSGSMRGLIDAARQNIWQIVNDLAFAKPTPKLRIALVTFGNKENPQEDGWVKVETDLTDDLDLVSQKLFALTTNGGDEYVGRVLDAATGRLSWSEDPKALQIVIVAGNESADQDKIVSYKDACKAAIARNILVNAIYCGNPSDNIAPGWQDVARRADGAYASIDPNKKAIVIPTPFDNRLTEFSKALNETYIGYGAAGVEGKKNQVAQDKNAEACNTQVAAQRALTKSTWNYNCSWDLVTSYIGKKITLDRIDPKLLPEGLRKMSKEELKAHLDDMQKTREKLQKRIAGTNKEREQWLVKERARRAEKSKNSFDSEVRKAIRAQAEARGFAYAGS